MNAFSIGLSALRTSQQALDLVGQNIANANTPGYHRQSLQLASRIVGNGVGLGVEVQQTRRNINPLVETALSNSRTDVGKTTAQLDAMRQVESLFAPGQGSVNDQLNKLFDLAEQLASFPENPAQRRVFLNTADSLATQINRLDQGLDKVRDGLRDRINETITAINERTDQIADLNQQIKAVEITGREANDLRDRRDQAIMELSDLIDVRVVDQPFGVKNVIAANAPLVIDRQAFEIQANLSTSDDVNLTVSVEGSTAPLTVTGGKLAGLLEARNVTVADFSDQLDTFAKEFIRQFDTIQATGIGLSGPQNLLTGIRSVKDPTQPLAAMVGGEPNASFPVQDGSLFLTVTDSSGNRVLTEIQVDVDTDSLNDLVDKINTGTAGVTASVNADNQLVLEADAGSTVDFAGRPPSALNAVPPPVGGSAVPVVSGVYTGSSNGTMTVTVSGSGNVGESANLQLVVNMGGQVITVNIGEGYTPGTPVVLGNGLVINIGAGAASSSSFSMPLVAEPDTTGTLAALGVNSLFQGKRAGDFQLRSDVKANPDRFATSRSGLPGDNTNLLRMAALRDQSILTGGTETFQNNLSSMVASVGAQVQLLDEQQTAQSALTQNLEVQQQSVAGVDPNEEILTMLQFQRSFQMATRYISAVNTALDDLLGIIS